MLGIYLEEHSTWKAIEAEINKALEITGKPDWKCSFSSPIDPENDDDIRFFLTQTSSSGQRLVEVGYELIPSSSMNYHLCYSSCSRFINGSRIQLDDMDGTRVEHELVGFPVTDYIAERMKKRGVEVLISRDVFRIDDEEEIAPAPGRPALYVVK